MPDWRIILPVVVFLGSFYFIQGMMGTSMIESEMSQSFDIEYNGTLYSNLTAGTQEGGIPQPPECNSGSFFIDGVVGCVGGYIFYFWDLTTFGSDILWLNVLILLPMFILLIVFILLLIVRLADVVIPF